MANDKTSLEKKLFGQIEDALKSTPAISEKQREEIEKLREDISVLCKHGEEREAGECGKRAIAILREGSPAKE